MAVPPAFRRASWLVPMTFAGRQARWPVAGLAACMRVGAAVAPCHALDLKPGPYDAGFQVDVRPAEAERLALAKTEG